MDFATRESLLLAPYAMHGADSAGRVHAEAAHSYRSPYQRDRDRIVHCSAYRRLAYKTQVFTGELGDYHRTRLTHTIEVASIARTLARALRLNEDLAEALALAHDIGHPPFGHAGEDLLDARLADEGGFNHNAQALRIVELLEERYPRFPGLNLSLEVLGGQQRRATKDKPAQQSGAPLLEVQIVDAADSIAYDTHDVDDALELGILEIGELAELGLWRAAEARVRRQFSAVEGKQLRRAVIHELIDWQVGELVRLVEARIAEVGVDSVDAVRRSPIIVAPSAELAEQKRQFEAFLFRHVYRHPTVLARRSQATAALDALFDLFAADPERLPERFADPAARGSVLRRVADHLASMTDRSALEHHSRLAAAGV